jgi:hypothetical protein
LVLMKRWRIREQYSTVRTYCTYFSGGYCKGAETMTGMTSSSSFDDAGAHKQGKSSQQALHAEIKSVEESILESMRVLSAMR